MCHGLCKKWMYLICGEVTSVTCLYTNFSSVRVVFRSLGISMCSITFISYCHYWSIFFRVLLYCEDVISHSIVWVRCVCDSLYLWYCFRSFLFSVVVIVFWESWLLVGKFFCGFPSFILWGLLFYSFAVLGDCLFFSLC